MIQAVLAAVILINPCPATAQDDFTVLDTIVVTDSGTKQKLLQTNSAITVLTEKDIKNSGQTRTSELISSIPGVVNQKSGSKTYFSIRGTRGTFTDGAVIYVDGRPINTGMYGYSKIDTIPLDNIEKIEVIKSPPASDYGADSARGAILITTKSGLSADEPFKGYASAETGSWNTHKLTAGIFGGKNDIDYSLNAYGMESDGYRQTDDETRSADAQAGYRFDGGRVNLILGVNDSKVSHAVGLTPADVQKDRRANGYWAVSGGTAYYVLPTRSDQEMVNAGIKLDYEKNEYLLNSALIFTQDNEIATEMKDFNHPAVNTRRDDEQDDRQDTRVDFKITGGRHFDLGKENYKDTLKLGLDYKNQDFDQVRDYPFNTLALSAAMTTNKAMADIKAKKEHMGLNLNNDLTLDRFGLETGIRLNKVDYELKNKVPSSVQADFDGDIDLTLSPSYDILENANLFITYNESGFYMPIGHYKLNMEKNDPAAQAKDLKPEQYQTWELGFKHQLNNALNYSIILYQTEVEDKVTTAYTGTTFVGYRNAGTATHKGIEVEVDGRPLEFLGYRFGFTTMDAEWNDGSARGYATPEASSMTFLDLSGKKVSSVPEYGYSAGLDIYPFRDKPCGSLTVSLDVHGFGEQYEDNGNSLKVDPTHLMDLKLTWVYGRLEWTLTCANIFDTQWEKYSNSTGLAHSRFTGGMGGIYPQDGRYLGAGVSFRF